MYVREKHPSQLLATDEDKNEVTVNPVIAF